MKKYDQLTRLLDFMEENIDSGHIRKIEQLQYDTINYKKVDRLPLTINATVDGFNKVPLKDSFNNPEKMLYNEILWSTNHSPYNSVRIKDDGPLMIRSNHGFGIIASMFGCKSFITNAQMPWVERISLDDAKKAFAKGLPNVKSGLGGKVIETYQYYHERLKSFPKCYSSLRITQPDIQRPYDTLQLIIGDEILSLIDDNPALTKEMLNVIADTSISFRKEVDPLISDMFKDAVFVNGYCCGGRVLLQSDVKKTDLSLNMYKQYVARPSSHIFDAFSEQGGGSMQYGGDVNSCYRETDVDKNLRCVCYENLDICRIKKTYRFYEKNKIAIVGLGFNCDYETVKQVLEASSEGNSIKTGLTLMCKANDVKHGIELLKRHKTLNESYR